MPAKNIRLGALSLDAQQFIASTTAIIAKSGKGKTYLGSKIVEQIVPLGYQTLWFDLVGSAWGLRAGKDGRPEGGLPFVQFGGLRGDLPLEPGTGKTIAEIVVKLGINAIFDLSQIGSGAQQRKWSEEFCEAIYHLQAKRNPKRPLYIVFDEADFYLPQNPQYPDQKNLQGAVDSLIRRGRNHGIRAMLITQRPARLHKDGLTQTDVLFVLNTSGKQDLDALADWVKAQADTERLAELRQVVTTLPIGEGMIWAPGWIDLQHVIIPERGTFDSSATPKLGAKVKAPAKLRSVDLDQIRTMLKPAEKKVPEPKFDAVKVVERIEVPILTPADHTKLDGLVAVVNALRDERDDKHKELVDATHQLTTATSALSRAIESFRQAPALKGVVAVPAGAELVKGKPVKFIAEGSFTPPRPTTTPQTNDSGITAPQMRILNALVRAHTTLLLPQVNLTLLATFSDYVPNAPTYRANLKVLQDAGLIDTEATDGGRVFWATTQGTQTATTDATGPMTLHDYQQAWLSRLTPQQRRVMEYLMAVYPESIHVQTLAPHVGYVQNAPTYRSNLKKLERVGMIRYHKGEITPTDLLFPPELL